MKEIKNDIIKKYSYGNYVIYIKDCISHYESYLQHEDFGIITMMIGLDKAKTSFEEYIKIINDNIIDYIQDYKEDYYIED